MTSGSLLNNTFREDAVTDEDGNQQLLCSGVRVVRNLTPSKLGKVLEEQLQGRSPEGREGMQQPPASTRRTTLNFKMNCPRDKVFAGPGKRINKRPVCRRNPNEFAEEEEEGTMSRLKLLMSSI